MRDHPTSDRAVFDALIISDLHLGSDNCQAKLLLRFLEQIRFGELSTKRLILNGDVFDSIDFRRLKKNHWRVLSIVRKLADQIEIVWINGNHDGSAEIVSHLLGVTVKEEYALQSGGKRILVLHGHRFDNFIERFPLTSRLADLGYRLLQRLDKTHTIARHAKSRSKVFLRCVEQVQESSREYARRHHFDAVCCGHTHAPAAIEGGSAGYYNSGSWTELPSHYLGIKGGRVELFAVLPAEPVVVEEPAPGLGLGAVA